MGGESPGRSVAGRPQLLCPRYAHVLTPYMNSVPAIIAKASAIHNPIIYAITHPKYRCSPRLPGPPSWAWRACEGVSFLSLVCVLEGLQQLGPASDSGWAWDLGPV